MKFRCHKESLLKEISIAQDVISSKNSFSILSNLYLTLIGNELIIKATDSKVNLTTSLPVQGEEDGQSKINFDKFIGIVRNFPDEEIIFEQNDSEIMLRNEKNKINFNLKSIAKEEYPEQKRIDDSKYFTLSQKDLIKMINQTLFAISDDDARISMNGVLLEKDNQNLNMIATDGKRMSYISKEFDIDIDIPDFKEIIIPAKILNIVKKICSGEGDILLAIDNNTLFIKINNIYLYSNLIEGQFPNYRKVIPQEQKYSARFKKTDLLEALKRVDLLVEKNTKKIYMDIQENVILLSSEKNDFGEAREAIECEYNMDPIILAFNSKYMEDPLRAINTNEIEIEFSTNVRAVTIFPVPRDDFFHIVMPMQNN